MTGQPLIILSTGGTGGHIFPAAALAQDLLARGYQVAVATDSRGEKYKPHFGDTPFYVLPAGTMGAGIMGKVKGLARLGFGIIKAGFLLRKLRPALVVGFG